MLQLPHWFETPFLALALAAFAAMVVLAWAMVVEFLKERNF